MKYITSTINALMDWADETYYPWPSITRCRLCDQRIFVWQDHERRDYKAELDNPRHLCVAIHSSGLVHSSCPGNPTFRVSVH